MLVGRVLSSWHARRKDGSFAFLFRGEEEVFSSRKRFQKQKNPATETHVSVSRVLSFDASRRASKLGARNRRTRSARRLAGRRPEVAPPPRLRVSRARPAPRHSSPRAHALLSPPPPAPWRSTSSSPAWAPPPRRTSPWRTSGRPRWSAGSPSPASPRRRRTRSAPTSRRFSRRWA